MAKPCYKTSVDKTAVTTKDLNVVIQQEASLKIRRSGPSPFAMNKN